MRRSTSLRAAVAAGAALSLGLGTTAFADNITDTIEGNAQLALVAGGPAGSAAVKVVANPNNDGDPGCNIDGGEELVLTFVLPAGIFASPASLTFGGATGVTCGTEQTVSFTASAGTGGTVTANITTNTTGAGDYRNNVSIPITVTAPAPTNTAPVVTLTGIDAALYEIGSEPTPVCDVNDAEQLDATGTLDVDRSALVYGLGLVTVTCSFTDAGDMSDSDSDSYTIVDTGNPTIVGTVAPTSPDGANGWYKTAPTVTFDCADERGSGIASCVVDGTTSAATTLDDGANQTVSGTATDHAGNSAMDSVVGLDVDTTAPSVPTFSAFAAGHFFGEVAATPTCSSTDVTSGATCVVSGYETSVGGHTLMATATNGAGLTATATQPYTVKPYTVRGFYSPVDMGGVVNTVKSGSTVPLKFEVFASQELTSTSIVTMATKLVSCNTASATDDIEVLATGATSLRYDSTGGQFVYNWQTPKNSAGKCYTVSALLNDGQSISANFLLK